MSDSVNKDQKKYGLKHILLNISAWLAAQDPLNEAYICMCALKKPCQPR
jgi:hypothetical protein